MISSKSCTFNDNLVYLNKIFFNESENSSPIMLTIDSAALELAQQINIGGGCNNNCCNCCCDFAITADTSFDITNSYVIVHSFQLADPTSITSSDVTVEGIPITAVTANGSQLVGDISGIMSQITKCACVDPCTTSCPGNYVMITADGPWILNATIVVEGNILGSGTSCKFKLCYNTSPQTPISVVGPASFALCNTNIPCQISGISPTLIFDFDACAKLLGTTLSVTCTDGVCVPSFTGSLVITPQINLQVLRPSLFNLGDYEVEIPCDDVGQCNPCNKAEAKCVNNACQCCDTNGYSF